MTDAPEWRNADGSLRWCLSPGPAETDRGHGVVLCMELFGHVERNGDTHHENGTFRWPVQTD